MEKEAVGMERERRAFEAWAKDHVDSLALGRNGGYAYADASRAWKAWQARAALAQQAAAQAVGLTADEKDRFVAALVNHGTELVAPLYAIVEEIERTLLSRAAQSGEPVAWLREDGSDAITAQKKRDLVEHNGRPGAKVAGQYSIALTYAAPHPSAQRAEQPAEEARPSADAIARSKRILEAVDTYHERPNSINWHALRCILMDQFTELLTKGAEEARGFSLSDAQWYDLAQRHANVDWNGNGYLASVKALCADYGALLAAAAVEVTGTDASGNQVTIWCSPNAPASVREFFDAALDAAEPQTQSAAPGLAPIHIGNLTTLNQDTYPGLGDWWVQLRIGPDFDEVLARVYGKSPAQARERAAILARAASEPRAEGLDDSAIEALRLAESALSECYDVTAWPADGKSECDKALAAVRAALAAQKGK
ncbi:hypothetical protein K7G19_21095 [Cupriavidus sp. DB3]|uniref:hypothetical protein n=1 Tax=Cupriavidus sp. DB3 TaxID=2873259 RepID=UPI001CF21242|nr:hypothetical protein [Cupriavidus sp. DB3]MCA7086091.1 hypothetical protein [Cupriavidus sp. DB3]